MLDQQDYEGRLRAAFQLEELRQAVCTAEGQNVPLSERFPLALCSLRYAHAQYRARREYKRALWLKLLIVDITFAGTFRKVRGRLMSELALVDTTPVSNTGVNLVGGRDEPERV